MRCIYRSRYHREHVAANSLFSGASFSIHPLDEPDISSEDGFYRLTGRKKIGRPCWDTLKQEGFTATSAAERHGEGDRIEPGGLTLQVFHTTGTHPRALCFLVEEYELLFTAEIALSSFGPWYGDESAGGKSGVRRRRRPSSRTSLSSGWQ